MLDLLHKAVLRGLVAEDYDVGVFFWRDGYLIEFGRRLFREILVEEQIKSL